MHVNHAQRLALALGVVFALSPRSGVAQQVDVRAINFGIGGGVSAPLSATHDAYKPGFNGNAFVRLDLGSLPWALRADFSYQNFELQDGRIPAAGAPGGGTGTLLAGLGMAQFYLRAGNLRPYLIAGAGVYSVRTAYDAETLTAQSETRFGARGGAGVLLTFGSLLLYAEGGIDQIASRPGAAVSEAIRAVPLTIGVVF